MFSFTSTIDQLRNHEVVIFGLGREGLSSYRFIRQYLPDIHITLIDDQPVNQLDPVWTQLITENQNTQFMQSNQVSSLSPDAIVIKSPGIPLGHPVLQIIHRQNLQVISNLQLFFSAIEELRSLGCEITTVGITGTKGKSTTTAVIHHVLKESGFQTWLGGNIGIAPLDLVQEINSIDQSQMLYVVLELSAHQLDDLKTSPNVAVIQNIVPEHLDYYGSFERYVAAKSHITQFQTPADIVIFNRDFDIPRQLAELSPGKKLAFTTQEVHSIQIESSPLLGEHNLENIMPAVILGNQLGLSNEAIARSLATFKPLPHRLEFVTEINGVRYYNDSLSTVPEATMAAITAFKDTPVILLAGGYDRGQDFDELASFLLDSHIKALLLFPPTGERLAESIKIQTDTPPVMHFVTSMREALKKAKEIAEPGDVVLLSPASASFGGFKDYQDRGDQFKAAVQSTN